MLWVNIFSHCHDSDRHVRFLGAAPRPSFLAYNKTLLSPKKKENTFSRPIFRGLQFALIAKPPGGRKLHCKFPTIYFNDLANGVKRIKISKSPRTNGHTSYSNWSTKLVLYFPWVHNLPWDKWYMQVGLERCGTRGWEGAKERTKSHQTAKGSLIRFGEANEKVRLRYIQAHSTHYFPWIGLQSRCRRKEGGGGAVVKEESG